MGVKFLFLILMSFPFLCFNIEAVDEPLLKAIAMIESGNNPYAIGKHGERSAYQMMEYVWMIYSNLSFYHYAKDRRISAEVANKHADNLLEFYKLSTKKEKCSYVDFYIMWHRGPYFYMTRNFSIEKVPSSIRERAMRFSNLVYMYYANN